MTTTIVPPTGLRESFDTTLAAFIGNAGASGSIPSRRSGSVISIGITICFMGNRLGTSSALMSSSRKIDPSNCLKAARMS